MTAFTESVAAGKCAGGDFRLTSEEAPFVLLAAQALLGSDRGVCGEALRLVAVESSGHVAYPIEMFNERRALLRSRPSQHIALRPSLEAPHSPWGFSPRKTELVVILISPWCMCWSSLYGQLLLLEPGLLLTQFLEPRAWLSLCRVSWQVSEG